jgi:exodeoxyribonuclease VII small subunit
MAAAGGAAVSEGNGGRGSGADGAGSGEGASDGAEETLEGRLRRLEEIMTRLEADDVPLEEALELFEEGVGHVRAAEKILATTELKVEELLSDGRTASLDPDGGA